MLNLFQYIESIKTLIVTTDTIHENVSVEISQWSIYCPFAAEIVVMLYEIVKNNNSPWIKANIIQIQNFLILK